MKTGGILLVLHDCESTDSSDMPGLERSLLHYPRKLFYNATQEKA